jgi:hypothetical protein
VENSKQKSKPQEVKALIQAGLDSSKHLFPEEPEYAPSPQQTIDAMPEQLGRYDFDLAEFPMFRLYKNELRNHDITKPLLYTDAIRGKGGELVERQWEAYAGRFGFGGPSTQVLLYDLLQLYVEQGLESEFIRFGSIHALFRRREERHPSERDYKRMIRDFEILCGYQFACKNAFWDEGRRTYVDMIWRLFDNVCFFRGTPNVYQSEMPFGFVKVNSVLQGIARSRGFFVLGFDNKLFYKLKPLEQRLAIYLAKRFRSQEVCTRFVDDLARALPIEASKPWDVRATLKKTTEGLLEKGLPLLQSYRLEKSGRGGQWIAYFYRKERPKDTLAAKKDSFDPDLEQLVNLLIVASGEPQHKGWWTRCARSLGRDGVFRAIGQFEETRRLRDLDNPGAMLTAIIKDVAKQQKIKIR